MEISDIARRIVQEEREAYCENELGWDRDKVVRLMAPPAAWIQRAVERALRESPECSRPCPLGDALNSLIGLLVEVDDLLPRISSGDPMAPALADWLRRVRGELRGGAA